MINENHMLVNNLCFVAEYILGYYHKYLYLYY
jgi:hypothetical protein